MSASVASENEFEFRKTYLWEDKGSIKEETRNLVHVCLIYHRVILFFPLCIIMIFMANPHQFQIQNEANCDGKASMFLMVSLGWIRFEFKFIAPIFSFLSIFFYFYL